MAAQYYHIIYDLIMAKYPLKIFPSGHVFLDTSDNCREAADALEEINYTEDFCLAIDFDPYFIARLMDAGFLVMSCRLEESKESNETEESDDPETDVKTRFILLPKHHLIRSCLFFHELHIKKTIRNKLEKYELRFDSDFDRITDNCIRIHGSDWLTRPFMHCIREIRNLDKMPVKPVSFALYRDNRLLAGEFGIISGRVYTSYSGYYEEENAGTIQMILTARMLEKSDFAFWDLGMPLDYKLTLGAKDISRKEFMELFRNASM